MTRHDRLTFKIATEDWEFEAIHALNYQTFVVEIPQHAPNDGQRLVDRFHAENTYIIALDGRRLVGMVCFRAQRPFSLDFKLPDLNAYLPGECSPCEIRLLAIVPEWRSTSVCRRLLAKLAEWSSERGHDLGLISGTTRQVKLYEHLGFEPFGPLVGSKDAPYQPMQLRLETFLQRTTRVLDAVRPGAINLLPGPVAVSERVAAAFAQAPVSHRSEEFHARLRRVERGLCRLTGAPRAAVLLGSGTLANDVVAAQFSLRGDRGLIVSNGEFGERLFDHARRWGLRFDDVRLPWGTPLTPDVLRGAMQDHIGWVWAVHGETSTGMQNDLGLLKSVCAERNIDLCLDCISTVGLVPVDLSGVRFATAVSGKGVAAYPGLAVVFVRDVPPAAPAQLPRVLDLGHAFENDGVPFTHSSNLMSALEAALDRDWPARYQAVAGLSAQVREHLLAADVSLVASEETALPGVITLALPSTLSSVGIGEELDRRGLQLSYRSEYLIRRNWIQICLMGEITAAQADAAVQGLLGVLRRSPTQAPVGAASSMA